MKNSGSIQFLPILRPIRETLCDCVRGARISSRLPLAHPRSSQPRGLNLSIEPQLQQPGCGWTRIHCPEDIELFRREYFSCSSVDLVPVDFTSPPGAALRIIFARVCDHVEESVGLLGS